MNIQKKARLHLIVAATTFGTVGVFVRQIDLPSAEIALYRGSIAILVLGLTLLCTGRLHTLLVPRKVMGILFLSGIAMAGNWMLIVESFRHTSVALGTLSYYFASTIVVVASTLLLKEESSFRQVLCFIGSTAGLVLCIGASTGGGNDLIGILFGLGAATCYATLILLNKVTREIAGLSRTMIQFVVAVIVLLPYVGVTSGFHLIGLDAGGIGSLLILGVVHTGLMYCLYFSAVGRIKGQQAAILSYIDPLVSVIMSIWVLGENVGGWQLMGGAMIVGFALGNEVWGKR